MEATTLIKRLLFLLALSPLAQADVTFWVPAGTTYYFTPCFPLYATANNGAGVLTGMSGTDANFIIYQQQDDTAADVEYQTTADVETISTIGTYAAPTADTDIGFGECGTPGTYQLQIRDTFTADDGTKMLTYVLTDGVDTMGDQTVYIDLNVADIAAVNATVDTALSDYDGPTDTEMNTGFGNLNDPTAEQIWNVDATLQQDAGTFGQAIGDPAANAETIYEAVITDAAGTNIAADVAAVPTAAEIWAISCEDQGAGYTCQEAMSIILAEAAGVATYTSGTRTWVVSSPDGGETRLTLVYGAELDGDRSTSTPAPMTP